MDYYDLSLYIKSLGYEHYELLADYIEECCCDGWNVKSWLANANYRCFNDKNELIECMEEENLKDGDCSIYNGHNGYVLEW